jgi:hypothetical protein
VDNPERRGIFHRFFITGGILGREIETCINDLKWIAKGAATLHQYEIDSLRKTTSIIGVFSAVN